MIGIVFSLLERLRPFPCLISSFSSRQSEPASLFSDGGVGFGFCLSTGQMKGLGSFFFNGHASFGGFRVSNGLRMFLFVHIWFAVLGVGRHRRDGKDACEKNSDSGSKHGIFAFRAIDRGFEMPRFVEVDLQSRSSL